MYLTIKGMLKVHTLINVHKGVNDMVCRVEGMKCTRG